MGLAVLPARLKDEMAHVKEHLLKGTEDISGFEDIEKHNDWYKQIRAKYAEINAENVDKIIDTEIGIVFSEVLSHAGVFKRNAEGQAAFDRFINSI